MRDRLVGDYNGIPYNWSRAPFHLGTGADWPGKYKTVYPALPTFDLVADYVQPGVVSFWLEPRGPIVVPIPAAVKKYVKPQNWNPQLALRPAYVFSWQAGCGYGLILVGGSIITFTIVEDVATLGLGTFDDAITIPGGIMFINIGQRLAVPIIP